MMGQLPAQQNALFYEFCLEKHIPDEHLLRQIDQFLDFDQTRIHLAPFYSHTGRPSIDPELMIRMLLIGYCYGIRSERRLCEEIRYNLAYRRSGPRILDSPVRSYFPRHQAASGSLMDS